MNRKWTKVLAVIFVLALFFMLVALAVAKWTDQMDPNTLPAAESPWRQVRNNLLVAGAGLCAMLVCVAIRGKGRRSKDDTDFGDMPWEK